MRVKKYALRLLTGWLVMVGCYGSMAMADPAPERVLWDKKPIPVALAVGQERLIHFPADIRYWLPDALKPRFKVLAANGVLYLEARQPIDKVRLRVQEVDSRQLYLLDITATETGDYPKELIVLQESQIINRAKQTEAVVKQQDWRIRLTRFAAQSLYAPERLISADSEIQRLSIDTTTPVPLIRGSDIEAIPVAAWRGGGLTVTAVRLRNLSGHTIVIGLRQTTTPLPQNNATRLLDLAQDIRGQWLTASVQHTELKATGDNEDRTCLYLISRQPFEASL